MKRAQLDPAVRQRRVDAYLSGRSLDDVAASEGINRETLRQLLAREGIELRKRGRNSRKFTGPIEDDGYDTTATKLASQQLLRAMLQAGQHTLEIADAWIAGATVGLSWSKIKRGIGDPLREAL